MIVIPMAGLSSRFFKAGYTEPKYMLEAHGKSIFRHSVESFSPYFGSEKFLFIIRDVYGTYDFIKKELKDMGVASFDIHVLQEETRGQAETVFLALEQVPEDESLTIFNIDTFRPGFVFPESCLEKDGYLEVFEGEGDNWSFIKLSPDDQSVVIETAEKKAISNLCCTGLYHFARTSDFKRAFDVYASKPIEEWDKAELYVAPLYNVLIQEGLSIGFDLIERKEVIFCGVPQEYIDFKESSGIQ
jgi:dTDP-glucose pyrophosphorylase